MGNKQGIDIMAFDFNPIPSLMYRIEGGWEEFCADIMEIWGALTKEDMALIEADHNKLVARIKMRYGVSTKDAEAMITKHLGARKNRRRPQSPA